jgi:hypothetical protein
VACATFPLPRNTTPLTDWRHNDSITIEITIRKGRLHNDHNAAKALASNQTRLFAARQLPARA